MTPGASRPRAARPVWKLRSPPDPHTVRDLEHSLKLPAPLCRLLAVRGYTEPAAARSFLRPLLTSLHDPALLLDAEVAARRIVHAIQRDEMVVVHGDYDADGVSGTALLTHWIRALGGRAEPIVPDRFRHGYDLSRPGVERAAARNASVLVTVDCGIAALEPVRLAADAGVDVIVTDHHAPGPCLPDALAVVNPNRPDCSYPNKDLCGAGVAFKVGQLVARALGQPVDEAWNYLDLVAVATVADQMKLQGENRVLTRYGLRVLSQARRRGLAELMRSADLTPGDPVGADAVAFRIGPRINAAGRVGDAGKALTLLLTGDSDEARRLASLLERNNAERRDLERRTAAEALAALGESYDPARDRAVVVVGEDWHPGVIGIVASRVVERIHRPAVVIALDGEAGRGSARSIPPFDLHGAISACSDHLDRFGGHHQAAGLDIRRDRIDAFREAFQGVARERLGNEEPRPVLYVDAEIGLGEIDLELSRYMRYGGPYGRGNAEPVFMARRVTFARPPRVLKGGHLKFRMLQNGSGLGAIGFRLVERVSLDAIANRPVDVAFTLLENTFRGVTTVEGRVVDIRPAE
ncbi:MAG: single-stranded-DNA-specific exonuclease RecJ [Gemmatimonadetes bacterium]|nr:single-stranded-DNA-specific exonuclease RecJ [Gemmatimonadota bacterium]MYB97323.1 single-stranded-DNA-specific exonuclease RecJ [Gemmatimonadota bacterium]